MLSMSIDMRKRDSAERDRRHDEGLNIKAGKLAETAGFTSKISHHSMAVFIQQDVMAARYDIVGC